MGYNSHSEYRQAWDQAFETDPHVPLNVDIELASLCNLACPFCYWGDKDGFVPFMRDAGEDGKTRARFMPYDTAVRLIDECAAIGVPALKFNFRGEATLNPSFSPIVACAADSGRFQDLLVNTNGNCPPRAMAGLLRCTKVMVSLDSLVEETYDQMRVGGDLAKACETVQLLLRLGHPNIWVRRVITKQNQHEPFAAEARATFGPKVHVSEHFAFDRSPAQLMLEAKDGAWERTYCGYPSQRLVVQTTGKVQACCVAWKDEVTVGEWPKQRLSEIWNGGPIQRLRASLRTGHYAQAPALCQNCTSYMSYRRKERDAVQDREAT